MPFHLHTLSTMELTHNFIYIDVYIYYLYCGLQMQMDTI